MFNRTVKQWIVLYIFKSPQLENRAMFNILLMTHVRLGNDNPTM